MMERFDDRAYFTLVELEAAFRLVTDDVTAKRLVAIWRFAFGEFVVDDRVVELPDQDELPKLRAPGERTVRDELGLDRVPVELGPHDQELETPIAQSLVGFTDLTLTLLAGSNPEVRRRFDRLRVSFARNTVDTPALWSQIIAGIRALGG